MNKFNGFTRDELLVGLDNIPQEMKDIPNWVVFTIYKENTESDRWEKVAVRVNKHGYINLGNPKEDCMPYDEALKLLLERRTGNHYGKQLESYGLGFSMYGSELSLIDMDTCINEQGKVNSAAKFIIKKYSPTFIEYSVSKKGLHVWYKGESPLPYSDGNKKKTEYKFEYNGEIVGGEWYDGLSNRMIAVTGILYEGWQS